jgi:hypothetical protein
MHSYKLYLLVGAECVKTEWKKEHYLESFVSLMLTLPRICDIALSTKCQYWSYYEHMLYTYPFGAFPSKLYKWETPVLAIGQGITGATIARELSRRGDAS